MLGGQAGEIDERTDRWPCQRGVPIGYRPWDEVFPGGGASVRSRARSWWSAAAYLRAADVASVSIRV